jgi:hypothetical protein
MSVVKVVDLVDLFMRDGHLAKKYFVQAQRFYEYSFPPEERESVKVFRRNISDSIKKIRAGKKVRFHYLVAVSRSECRGMMSFNLLPVRNVGLVAFLGYIVTQMNYKRTGIGRALIDGVESVFARYAKTGMAFGEIEQPRPLKKNAMRDVIRPEFHTKHTGMGVIVVERRNGKVCIVPYKQPGIMIGKRVPAPVPLLPCITRIVNGKFLRINPKLVNKAVTKDGRLNKHADISVMSSDTVYAILSAVLNKSYGSLPDVYSKKQISVILESIKKVLEKADNIYIVPISDCAIISSQNKGVKYEA